MGIRSRKRRGITKKRRLKRRGGISKKYGGGVGKIKMFNWWSGTNPDEMPEYRYFEALLDGCSNRFNEVHVYSVFPVVELNVRASKILTIQYSGETIYGNPNNFDINIIPDEHTETSSLVRAPMMHLYMWLHNPDMTPYTIPRSLVAPQSKFCLFSVSSETDKRVSFFNELSKYKRVDSCGSVLNNLGYNCPGTFDSKEYHDFINHYKFMICFENTSMKDYLTEKLIIAYSSGTIPIYWGCPNLADYVNMDAILCLKPDNTAADVQALIGEIQALDQDEALYKKKFESIFFKNGMVPDAFNMEKLNQQMRAKVQAIKP